MGGFTAHVRGILGSPSVEWRRICSGSSRCAFRHLDVDWKVYNNRDYLFTHDSIVASVATEPDGYTIRPNCVEIVNANGNAWTNDVLLHCYKTFIGGENYQDHIQVPSLSKGKILDAVIREVTHRGERIYVVDILVATNRMHRMLCDKIESGQLRTMSMGAVARMVQCSVCGRIIATVKKEPLCEHLEKHLRQYVDYRGERKYCAELCGAMDPRTKEYIPDSCMFIEASWVEEPAYGGAVTNYLIETPEMRVERTDRKELENLFTTSLVPSLRVADRGGAIAYGVYLDALKQQRVERIARGVLGE